MLNILFVDINQNRHLCQLDNDDDDDLLDYVIESFLFLLRIFGDQRREITSVDSIQNDFFLV